MIQNSHLLPLAFPKSFIRPFESHGDKYPTDLFAYLLFLVPTFLGAFHMELEVINNKSLTCKMFHVFIYVCNNLARAKQIITLSQIREPRLRKVK